MIASPPRGKSSKVSPGGVQTLDILALTDYLSAVIFMRIGVPMGARGGGGYSPLVAKNFKEKYKTTGTL